MLPRAEYRVGCPNPKYDHLKKHQGNNVPHCIECFCSKNKSNKKFYETDIKKIYLHIYISNLV